MLACASSGAWGQQTAPAAPEPAPPATSPTSGTSPGSPASSPTGQPDAFDLDIEAPANVRPYLERHLDLQRYRAVSDLDANELARLLAVAERDLRELLGTLGYFSPTLSLAQKETPGNPHALRHVTITVDTGEPTRISAVDIDFSGPISTEPAMEAQRRLIVNGWRLRRGQVFTQAAWDDSKTEALRQLTSQHFPKGQVLLSTAEVDPRAHTAALHVTLDSGPVYKLGPLQVTGLNHFDATTVQRLVRLSAGADYTQESLLQAQQRLSDSGFFDSAYITLDTEGDPRAAPVLVQLREAKLQKLVLGVGASTDSGPRVSVEHTHHQLPWLGWGALSKLSLDRATQSIGTQLTAPPDDDNWRWVTSAQAQRENSGSFKLFSQQLRAGRTQITDKYDRSYFLQYERADTTDPSSANASALSVNYAWTQRQFDSLPFPGRGYGLGVEVGAGSTLGSDRQPFVRLHGRWLGVVPLDRNDAAPEALRSGRLALRLEGGAVLARDGTNLPATQLFLAGGDASVRGYAYKEIGVVQASGQVAPGRYLAVGSVEWQRPIRVNGDYSQWEQTVFIDAGAVANQAQQLRAKVGFGTGARWKSPVGPLQMDLAYGVADKRLRLHLSVGFTF